MILAPKVNMLDAKTNVRRLRVEAAMILAFVSTAKGMTNRMLSATMSTVNQDFRRQSTFEEVAGRGK